MGPVMLGMRLEFETSIIPVGLCLLGEVWRESGPYFLQDGALVVGKEYAYEGDDVNFIDKKVVCLRYHLSILRIIA